MVGVMDIDDGVRNDAIRALGILAGFAMKNPTLNISILASPFIELLNSVSWTDLNKAGFILLSLTANRNQKILKQLKREALGPLTDMALWKSEGHAMPGFMILGRIAGWTDKEIYEAIKANRVEMVAKMLNDIQS